MDKQRVILVVGNDYLTSLAKRLCEQALGNSALIITEGEALHRDLLETGNSLSECYMGARGIQVRRIDPDIISSNRRFYREFRPDVMIFDDCAEEVLPPDRVKGPKGPRTKWGKLK